MRIGEIAGHERNPKHHPAYQRDAVSGILGQVGKADVLKAYTGADGRLKLWDGHLRQDLDPDQEWWVAITDLSEEEAELMLVAFDPLAALAEPDAALMEQLLTGIVVEDPGLQQLLDELGEGAEAKKKTELAEPGPKREMGDPHKQIKPVLYAEDIADFERAILATGEQNRGRALMQVCRYFLENSEKGQQHLSFESLAAAQPA